VYSIRPSCARVGYSPRAIIASISALVRMVVMVLVGLWGVRLPPDDISIAGRGQASTCPVRIRSSPDHRAAEHGGAGDPRRLPPVPQDPAGGQSSEQQRRDPQRRSGIRCCCWCRSPAGRRCPAGHLARSPGGRWRCCSLRRRRWRLRWSSDRLRLLANGSR